MINSTLRRAILAAGLVSATALAVWGDRSPKGVSEVARVAERAGSAPSIAKTRTAPTAEFAPPAEPPTSTRNTVQRLRDRHELIGRDVPSRRTTPPALFAAVAAPVHVPRATDAPSQSPPGPPPFPFTYLGKQRDGEQWTVFLKRADGEPLAVREGDVIDATYQVRVVTASSVNVEYLPMQHRHLLDAQ